jgi:hypothetical protein
MRVALALEAGAASRPEVWSRLLRVFQGEFIGFAIWFDRRLLPAGWPGRRRRPGGAGATASGSPGTAR